ncbi:DUF4402 domain-containing protein [Chitinophaga sancti]|uniref:DUF4402 domain-containing protein n=1 Tax=Chitinophaga sancti TaxID=1004 RepID=A0A1K1RXK5_9BACT|nr:DUF4402 domain-containing protein [Chitinophaga sancti]WQD64015.1 DUF4402 domain-containing protein [Chitinophaga sancti]WQG90361.1 DUF4402 domain-containing protein [Chitinophaga sancti]SFW76519.1 protein of unknown function [Chitinophaga sancti]
MKKKLLFAALTCAFASFAIDTKAQETAQATATATIVTPISITKDVDMNFGNVAVRSTAGGTVVLTPAGVRTSTGGVTLPTDAGTVAAASFTVTGVDGYSYSITLPTSAVTLTSGANTMTATTFTSDPSGTGTLTGGTQTLNVGATLNVAAAQPAGTYVSGAFDVTVNYN